MAEPATKSIAFLWPESDFRATGIAVPDGYALRFGAANDRALLEANCAGADYIIAASGFGQIDKPVLDSAPALRLVAFTGAGFDNIDHAECRRRGIPVTHCPGLNAPSVAQLIVQLAFRLRRPLPLLAAGGPEAWAEGRAANIGGQELEGRVGIVGYGAIGKATARLFAGLGLEVVRAAHRGQDDDAVPALDIKELFATADIIAVSLPLNPATTGLIDRTLIDAVKADAILINAGRGGIVDEQAVVDALADGRLAGAGFDVFATEPLPADHPFLSLPEPARARLILTPHIGGQTRQSKTRNFGVALDNVRRVADGAAPLYPVPTG